MVASHSLRHTYTSDIQIVLVLKKIIIMDRVLKMILHSIMMALLKRRWTFWVILEASTMILMEVTVEKLMLVYFF